MYYVKMPSTTGSVCDVVYNCIISPLHTFRQCVGTNTDIAHIYIYIYIAYSLTCVINILVSKWVRFTENINLNDSSFKWFIIIYS